METKPHAKDWLIPENLVKRLSIDVLLPMANSIILTTKAAKGKKGTIVATITGTKAQTVVAL
jgi:hypothetical protein